LYLSLAATSAALFFLQILFVAFNYDNNNTSASRSLTSLRWRHIVFVFVLLPVLSPVVVVVVVPFCWMVFFG